MEERQIIYDWNTAAGRNGAFDWGRARVDLNDETLRDGLQSPSVTDPSLDVKKSLLHLTAGLGIVAADPGPPPPPAPRRLGSMPKRGGWPGSSRRRRKRFRTPWGTACRSCTSPRTRRAPGLRRSRRCTARPSTAARRESAWRIP